PQIVAVTVEHENGWILPLKRVDAVLGIGGDGADRAERPAGGQHGPLLVDLVGIAATADSRHRLIPPRRACLSTDRRRAARPPRSRAAASDDPTPDRRSPR